MSHIVANFKPFTGVHCETSATGTLLKQIGVELSEPMLFGIGQGLGFIFWNMKTMDYPFLGGRIKQDAITRNIANHLNLHLEVRETASLKKAWENVKSEIDENIPVGLKLDCYHLDYFKEKIHFAGHYVTLYGYDETYAYLTDTNLGPVRTSIASLELARSEKGPMSSKNLSYSIQRGEKGYDLKEAVLSAIRTNAGDYLNPPISNIGYKGIKKAAEGIIEWFKVSANIKSDFRTTAMLMEEGGTGGALFRNLYRDFLKESYALLGIERLNDTAAMFNEIAAQWTRISQLFGKTAETESMDYILEASQILITLSQKEKWAMELLLEI